MKHSFIFSIVFLFFSATVFSQFGNNGNNNYYRGGYGSGQQELTSPTMDEKTPSVRVDEIMVKLKPELNLDALQEVAIKQILLDDIKARGIVVKKETDEKAKFNEILALNNKVDTSILALLNSEQKEQYKVFKEKSNNPKLNKKSKKKEKNNKK